MKSCLLLLVLFFSISASCRMQGITMNEKNVVITKVFAIIEKQTSYIFFYNLDLIKKAKTVNINVVDASVEKVLQICFKGQPLSYSIVDQNIVVKERTISSEMILEENNQVLYKEVKGKVIDEQMNPIVGASIVVVGTSLGTTTNDKGEFILSGLTEDAILRISSVGFETRNVPVKGRKTIIARLELSIQSMSNVTVNRGYYTTTQKLNTGSVKKVDAAVIERQAVTNPLHALQGRVAGLYIAQTNGFPGAPINIQLRGQNSLISGKNPLIIIDGVPISIDPLDRQGNSAFITYVNGGTSPLNSINPYDIASIEVLKDADATSIYGSRGANGVILITTKKGQTGATSLDINFRRGFASVTKLVGMMNITEYLSMRRQAFANDNVVPTAQNAPDLVVWDQKQGRDWEKEFLGNTAAISDISVGISGGDLKNRYNIRSSFHKETTVFPGDFSYKRGGVQFSTENNSINGKFGVNTAILYSSDNNLLPGFNPVSVRTLPPNFPVYGIDGKYHYFNGSNPYAALASRTSAKSNSLNGNVTLRYTILPDLVMRISNGYNRSELTNFTSTPTGATDPASASNEAIYTNNYSQVFITEPQLQYSRRVKGGRINLLAGGAFQETDYVNPYFIIGSDYASDVMLRNIGSAGTLQSVSNASTMYKYGSLYTRASWELNGKYIINGSFRRDGSSRFGPGNRFGNFGAIGAAWIFSDEEFGKSLSWLSFGKMRGSYGTTGNDQTSDYVFLETYITNNFPYGTSRGYTPTRVYNPYFNWELTRKLELASEFGFLNNRLMLNVGWFRNRSSNMIATVPLTPQTGFSNYMGNFDALVQNSGWEIELFSRINSNKFSWNTSLNFTAVRNNLLRLPGIEKSTYRNTYAVGRPLTLIPLYRFTGFKDGVAQIEDINGNGSISAGLSVHQAGDQIAGGDRSPQFYGGFENIFNYGNWQLDLFFQFVKQDGLDYRYVVPIFPGVMTNQPAEITTAEFKPTQSVNTASRAYNFFAKSTAMLTDASFIRLKNIALNFQLPGRLARSLLLRKCKFSMIGQNLFTITKFKGFDPEAYSQNLPPLKVISLGLQLNF